MEEIKRPGGKLSTRPLHFIWLCDCSSSMAGSKIQSLNTAIREVIPHMQKVAEENVNAQVLVRAVKFSSEASWHIREPVKVEDFKWEDLEIEGSTSMGAALELVAAELKIPPMTDRALPPVLVLVSDGQPTDNFDHGLTQLMALPWGKKAVRIAIAIGEDADMEVLQRFIGHGERKPLKANTPEALVNYIRWASTAVLQAASAPTSQTKGAAPVADNVPIPPPPEAPDAPGGAQDVW